jgi:hypothetical protein
MRGPMRSPGRVAVLRRSCGAKGEKCVGEIAPEAGDDGRDFPLQPAPYTFGLFEALSNYRTFELLRPHCDKSRYSGRGNLRRTSQAVVSLVSLRIAL